MNSNHHMRTGTSGTGTGETGMGTDLADDGSPMSMHMGNSSMGGMMMMYFHTGIMEYILFKQLQTHTAGGFALACVVIFLAGFLYEMMKYGREELLRHDHAKMSQQALDCNDEQQSLLRKPRSRMWSRGHLMQTALQFVQLWLSYCLMLVFMTYNVYLCLSLVLGATLGFFLVGWKRTASGLQDHSQHCQ